MYLNTYMYSLFMAKTNTTLSLDVEIKERFMELSKPKGINLSFFVERCMVDYINKSQEMKGGIEDGIRKKEENK